MAEQKIDEKREYVRADLMTRIKVQPVSRQEFERNKAMQTIDVLDAVNSDGSATPDASLVYLADRLIRIEEKLDQLLWRLDPDRQPEETATYGTTQNVSGAGVSLTLKEALDPGQLVLISLTVPGFSIGFLQAYGEVVRVKHTGDNKGKLFETSIKFIVINEAEREKLISYAFCRQRQEIRSVTALKEKEQEALGDE